MNKCNCVLCFRIGIWSLSLIEAVSGAWGGFGGGVRKVRGVAQYEEGKVRPSCPSCYPSNLPNPDCSINSSSLEEKTLYAELGAFKSLEVFRLGKTHFHLITILSIRCPPKCQSTSPMSHYLPWTCLHKNPNTLRAKTTSSPNKRHSCENFGSLYQSLQAANFASFYHFITDLRCESNQTVQTLTISS